MTFGPALSLGVSSLGEVVDVKVAADVDPAALLDGALRTARSRACASSGARVSAADDPGVSSKVVDTARYAVGIPRSALATIGGDDGVVLGESPAAWRAPELVVVRRIDGIGKRVDVREFLRAHRDRAPKRERSRARASSGDLVTLAVEVDVRGSGGVKIAEVVEALFGAELPHRACASRSASVGPTALCARRWSSRRCASRAAARTRRARTTLPCSSRSRDPLGDSRHRAGLAALGRRRAPRRCAVRAEQVERAAHLRVLARADVATVRRPRGAPDAVLGVREDRAIADVGTAPH